MKKHVVLILPLLIAVFFVPSMTATCMGLSTYELGVEEGDWVEYNVAEVENWEFFTEIHSGDRLRFEVIEINVQEIMYPNTTVAFEVEVPVCDVLLNGEYQGNVTLREMLVLPKGEGYWRALEKIEENWKIEAPKYGITCESDIAIGKDTVLFSERMVGSVNGGFKQTVHKDSGVAVEFERYLDAGENSWEYRLVIDDTTVSGVVAPWYVTYWYLIVLLAVVVIIIALLRYRSRSHTMVQVKERPMGIVLLVSLEFLSGMLALVMNCYLLGLTYFPSNAVSYFTLIGITNLGLSYGLWIGSKSARLITIILSLVWVFYWVYDILSITDMSLSYLLAPIINIALNLVIVYYLTRPHIKEYFR